MKHYLLFDSGCGHCSKLAQEIEQETGGYLIARSLHDPSVRSLLRKARPNYRWQPTLLGVNGDQVQAATGLVLGVKLVKKLGVRRACRIAQLVCKANTAPKSLHVGRRRFLSQGGALLASLALLGVPRFQNVLSFQTRSWRRYKDKDYGFALEYPADWHIFLDSQQPRILIDDEAIIKRLTFSASHALMHLDVWLARDHNLKDWLEWYAETREVRDMHTHPNSSVADQEAVTFLQLGESEDLLVTFFSYDKYVYRLLNRKGQNKQIQQIYQHMLDSCELREKETKATANPFANQMSRPIVPLMVSNCCDYNSPGNPFPCCTDGNCTWWAYHSMSGVPFTGNAGTWWGQAPDHIKWTRGSNPPQYKRSIAWMGGSPGHVAYVDNYTGGSTIDITDMTCGTQWECVRSVSDRAITYYDGYIYRFKDYPHP